MAPTPQVLHQLLQYHVLHDSLAVASRLLAIGPAYPSAEQLALDMLHRLVRSGVLFWRGRDVCRCVCSSSFGVGVTFAAARAAAAADVRGPGACAARGSGASGGAAGARAGH
jgi:hypothetical protein